MFDWVLNTPLQALVYFCGIQTVNGNILIRQNSILIYPIDLICPGIHLTGSYIMQKLASNGFKTLNINYNNAAKK